MAISRVTRSGERQQPEKAGELAFVLTRKHVSAKDRHATPGLHPAQEQLLRQCQHRLSKLPLSHVQLLQ